MVHESLLSVVPDHKSPGYCTGDHINNYRLVLKPQFGATAVGVLHVKLNPAAEGGSRSLIS